MIAAVPSTLATDAPVLNHQVISTPSAGASEGKLKDMTTGNWTIPL